MMNVDKLYDLSITLLICSFLLLGCSNDKGGVVQKNPNNGLDMVKPTEVIPTKEVEPTITEPGELPEDNDYLGHFMEQVILDQQDIRITATSLENGVVGLELGILIENNSNKNITVQTRTASINGYMVESSFSEDISKGKKLKESVQIQINDSTESVFDKIGELQLVFVILDTDTWDDIFTTDVLTITSSNAPITSPSELKGDVLYEQDGIKIVHMGLDMKESSFGPTILFYIENATDAWITVLSNNVSVNGYMVESTFYLDIENNMKAYQELVIQEFEDLGLVDITKVEIEFDIMDGATWQKVGKTDRISLDYEP